MMIAIRNALAHSSTMSIDAMNTAIRNAARTRQPDLRQLARGTNRVTASGIGTYLTSSMSWAGSPETRVIVIAGYIRGLGDKFRV